MQYAYCHCVDVFVWTVVGSVAGVACAVATVIFGVLPYLRRRREVAQPEISSELGPPVASGDGPVVVGDIPEEPPGFQPRTDLLALLDAAREGSRIVVVRTVTGMRGVGKTQLAAAYARMRLNERWRLVGWVNAEDPGTLLAHLGEVAAKWGLEAADAEAAGRAIRHRLETGGDRCLLVFDNVTDPELVQPFLPVSGESRVILTSNNQSVGHLGLNVPVKVFTEHEALAYLAERTGRKDDHGARLIAQELGWLPLALAQAAALIADQHLDYGTYLDRMRRLPVSKLLVRVQAGQYPYGLAEAVLLSLGGVRDQGDIGKMCIALIEIVSVLPPDGVPRVLLHTAASCRALARICPSGTMSDTAVDEALGRLGGSSLVAFSVDGEHVRAHPLVMRVVREKMTQDRLGIICQAVSSALIEHAKSVRETWKQFPVRELVEQISAAYEYMESLTGPPDGDLTRSKLQLRLERARFLDDLGDSPAQAIEVGDKLLKDAERELGARDPFTLTCRHNLAIAYQQAGRLSEAVTLYEQNLTERERILPKQDPDTLTSRNNLATAYHDAGRLSEAMKLYEQNLKDRERILGVDDPDTMASRNNLATAYQDDERVEEAIPLHEKNLPAKLRTLRAGLYDALSQPDGPAVFQREMDHGSQVKLLHERTRADGRRTIGAGHPDSLGYLNNLATAYLDAGRIREAAFFLECTCEEKEKELGPNHPSTLISKSNLAIAYLKMGHTQQATGLLAGALTDCEDILGSDHPTTRAIQQNLDVCPK
jgi:tetratricopeptide (TPR) repeat protein